MVSNRDPPLDGQFQQVETHGTDWGLQEPPPKDGQAVGIGAFASKEDVAVFTDVHLHRLRHACDLHHVCEQAEEPVIPLHGFFIVTPRPSMPSEQTFGVLPF